jgi:hypothetical protein
MGSTVSICNFKNVALNIALRQITPLYYKNKVCDNWFSVFASDSENTLASIDI